MSDNKKNMENGENPSQNEVLIRLNEALRTAFHRMGVQKKSEMAKILGYKSPYFSGVTTGKEKLSNAFLLNLSAKIGVNTAWVLNGTGSILLNKEAENDLNGFCTVPLVPISAHGGSLTNFSQSVSVTDCERVVSPIKGIDVAVPVSGDSMAPEYPNGSVVLVKRIDPEAFIEWGKAYVLDTRNGLVLKVLVPSARNGAVKCLSINTSPIFAPFDVDKTDIYNIYAVKGLIARK